MANSLDRRSFLKNSSAAGMAAAVAVGTINVAGAATHRAAAEVEAEGAPKTWLHDFLRPGMPVLGDWTLQAVSPVFAGGLVVLVENSSTNELIRIDICGRGTESLDAVESTKDYDFYLMNAGNGSTPTDRRLHLVVRALAAQIKTAENRHSGSLSLLPHSDRLSQFGTRVVSSNPFS